MSPIRMSRVESAVRVVLDYYEALNRGDFEELRKLLHDDCTFENADHPDGSVFQGKEAVIQFWQDTIKAKPGFHFKREDVFGLGFRTIMRWRLGWEEPDGKKFHFRGMDVFHIENSLIRKQFSYVKGL